MKEAVVRAKLRASVVNTLDQKFSKNDSDEDIIREDDTGRNNPINAVKVFQSLFCDSDERTYNNLKEQMYGKSLVLDNSKTQSEAVKAVSKIRNKLNRTKAISKITLKKRGLCLHSVSVQQSILESLNSYWLKYISYIMQDSRSIAQLQARVMASEMIGARVTVIECPQSKLVGVEGVIVRESENCYFIGVLSSPTPIKNKSNTKKRRRRRRSNKIDEKVNVPQMTTCSQSEVAPLSVECCNNCLVVMFPKKTTSLAFKLPTHGHNKEPLPYFENICVLHARNKLFEQQN